MFIGMKYNQIIITFLLASTAYVGDEIVFNSKITQNGVLKALCDNIVHALIGFLSSLLFFSHDFSLSVHDLAVNVVFCTLISSLIDIDHIIVARSILWKNFTHNTHRGLFHCTTACLSVTTLYLAYGYIYKKVHHILLGYMLLIAFTSHQLRDANRRGFWMYPFGHTPPVTKFIYISMTCIIPCLLNVLYRSVKPQAIRYTSFNHIVQV